MAVTLLRGTFRLSNGLMEASSTQLLWVLQVKLHWSTSASGVGVSPCGLVGSVVVGIALAPTYMEGAVSRTPGVNAVILPVAVPGGPRQSGLCNSGPIAIASGFWITRPSPCPRTTGKATEMAVPFAMLGEAFGNRVLNEPRLTLLTFPSARTGVPSSAMYRSLP